MKRPLSISSPDVAPAEVDGCGPACAPRKCTLMNSAAESIQARYSALTEQIPALTYTAALDEASTTLSISSHVEAWLGITRDDFLSDPQAWSKCLHPEDRERVFAELADWRARGDSLQLEYRLIGRDGRVRWILDQGRIVRDRAGAAVCLQGAMLDVTMQKETEAGLRMSEERFRKIVECSQDIFSIRDLEGRCVYFQAPEEYGVAEKDVLGKTLHETLDQETADRLLGHLREAAQGKTLTVERWVTLPAGKHCFLETVYPIRDDSGKVSAVAKIARDITERKKAEEALRRSEARSRLLFETAPDGILLIDEAGSIESVNPAAEELFGYASAEAVGLDVRALIPAFHNVRPTCSCTHEPARNGEAIGQHQDGTSFPIDLAIGELHLDGRRLFTAIVRDITDRKVLREQLFRAQKMEAVGRLAGGIAHDFNNYLTVVSCNIDLMAALVRENALDAPELQASLEQMRQAWQGATSLTRQLLAFSRQQVSRPESLNANRVIGGMETMLRALIGEHIHLEMTLCGSADLISADAGQLEQVLMNLVVNARDAMPEGGWLRIETSHEMLLPGHAPVAETAGGAHLCIKVADDGMGMPAHVLRHIFEPFFTTKPLGKGTGLGLPTVYGIIKQSAGHITVESESGQGTVFRVYFPITAQPAPAGSSPPRVAPEGGRETILVCEDEPMILRLTTSILKAQGYRVLSASGPLEAIDLAAEHVDSIDLLVTDVIMPEMNGRRLAEQLTAQIPAMALLFVSGYTADIISENGVIAEEVELLEKPFTPGALLERVRALLQRRSAPVVPARELPHRVPPPPRRSGPAPADVLQAAFAAANSSGGRDR